VTQVPDDQPPPHPTLADVEAAAQAIAGGVVRTPSHRAEVISQVLGVEVVLKFENLQFTSSFKERGALNKLLSLSAAERERGVVALSAGNHAQAVARHAARLGIDATIVMPAATPFTKVHGTQALGARVVLAGASLEEAAITAQRLVGDEGRVQVHPYDDAMVIAGQGTVALELLADHPELDALVVPTGGGGLLAGMAVAARAVRPDLLIVGAQSDRWPSMARALGQGRPGPGGPTIADGIAVGRPGDLAVPLVRRLVDAVVTVPDEAVEEAIDLLLEVEKVVVEGAGAAGLAAVARHRERFEGRTVGVVLTGGNIDARLLASVIMRGLVRRGRLTRLRVEVPDSPGNLGRVAAVLGEVGANIVEVLHQRLLLDVPARSTELVVVVETLDHDHLEQVLGALRGAGFTVDLDAAGIP
jgi:threonine dehydratase